MLTEPVRILHFAPAPCLTRRFRQLLHAEYVTTDLSAPGVDVKSDITDLAIYDGSFDVIVNSHVLEHVPDDRTAMRQLHRVLRPGGLLFLQVPYNRNGPTDEDLTLTDPAERTRRFGQFDHVRHYGTDLVDRLSQAGFHVDLRLPMTEMAEAQARRLGLWNDVLFLCARDDDPTAGARLLKT